VATVIGLAPGSWAFTEIVGKSTCGSGATGNLRNPSAPAKAMPSVKSLVATGRAMNGAEMFIRHLRAFIHAADEHLYLAGHTSAR
jgi:hypothetical protein